jgi:hypothetical protein
MKTVEELQKEINENKAQAETNIKALQQKLTEKDQEVKKGLVKLEELEKLEKVNSQTSESEKKIEILTKTVEGLTTQIGNFNIEKQREEIAKAYPDILPDLLLGKSPEEREIIVNKQREITMRNYDQKPSAHAPMYRSRDEIDTAIEQINQNKKLNVIDKLTKIRELKLKKDEI